MNAEKTSILIVDDSAMERFMVSHILQQDGRFSVDAVAGGCEAMDSLQQQRPQIIVTDLHMPEMNGLELIHALRNHGDGIPVILMTSLGSDELVVNALKAGAASYVPKLHLRHSLVKTIRRVLVLEEHRRHRHQSIDELAISEWCFALEDDPDSVPYLISHLLDLVVKLKQTPGQDVARVSKALKRVLSIASASGTLELGGELRGALGAYQRSATQAALVTS